MSEKRSMLLGAAVLGGVLVFAVHGITTSIASGRYEREHGEYEYEGRFLGSQSYNTADAALYREECGACHMAYPPQLLPTQSWQELMSNLDDHFGEDAELDEDDLRQVGNFLVQFSRAAGVGRMSRGLGDRYPLRITDLPYFRHEHDEIPRGFLQGNDKVSSLSQCDACHRQAQRGWFDEDDIRIPGVGRWHD